MTDAQRKYIEDLYEALYDNKLSYAGSSLVSEELAEEAVQETFRIACRKHVPQARENTGEKPQT